MLQSTHYYVQPSIVDSGSVVFQKKTLAVSGKITRLVYDFRITPTQAFDFQFYEVAKQNCQRNIVSLEYFDCILRLRFAQR